MVETEDITIHCIGASTLSPRALPARCPWEASSGDHRALRLLLGATASAAELTFSGLFFYGDGAGPAPAGGDAPSECGWCRADGVSSPVCGCACVCVQAEATRDAAVAMATRTSMTLAAASTRTMRWVGGCGGCVVAPRVAAPRSSPSRLVVAGRSRVSRRFIASVRSSCSFVSRGRLGPLGRTLAAKSVVRSAIAISFADHTRTPLTSARLAAARSRRRRFRRDRRRRFRRSPGSVAMVQSTSETASVEQLKIELSIAQVCARDRASPVSCLPPPSSCPPAAPLA